MKKEMYTLELFANGTPTEEVMNDLKSMETVKGVYFESNPNKIHDSILVDIEVEEDKLEKVIEDIENEYYSKDEVIDMWEYFNED